MLEPFLALLALAVIIAVFVLPIVAIVRSGNAARSIERLTERITGLEVDIVRLKQARDQVPVPKAAPVVEPPKPPVSPEAEHPAAVLLRSREPAPATATPPALPRIDPRPPFEPRPAAVQPMALPPRLTPPPPPSLADKIKGTLNWEQFMGAKLFAWIGGLALFLGVAYFVKYSFEHNLIPPEVRVAIGFLLGIGLVVGGVLMRRKEYAITAQTLCGTGILILYAVTFACRGVYHFPYFSQPLTFALMALITATAFLLAVRLDAQVVAVLGILGGFLTPVLLSTGQDAVVALFSYIALLNAGLIAVALHRRWLYLVPLAAVGTIVMEIGWAAEFFEKGEYFLGNKVLIPMTVLLGFSALWLGSTNLALKRKPADLFVSVSALALAAVAFCFTFYFIGFASLGARPWLVLGFAFLVDVAVLCLTRIDRRLAVILPFAGAAAFLLLAVWLGTRVTNELLPAALVFTLVFAALHSILPLALQRRDGDGGQAPQWTLFFPPLALLVLLVPIFKLRELTLFIWPVILLVDVLAVVLAAMVVSAIPVVAVLVLTLIAAGAVLFKIPAELIGLSPLLVIVGACAVFFVGAGVWLWRKQAVQTTPEKSGPTLDAQLTAQIPAFAIVMPFALLIMMVGRLQLANPSPVFALAMLFVGMLFAVTRMFRLEWLPLVGLACVAALEHAWHFRLFNAEFAATPLVWYLAFFAAFTAYPFVLARPFAQLKGPWVASALAGPVQFFLIYHLLKIAWPNLLPVAGLIPAAFAIPAAVCLVAVIKLIPNDSPARLTHLALFGGVTLFFITLIFPIQWERQWLTIAWALEGAALCWLFHRVPHPGLRVVGLGLLITAFVRLALNPAVLSYHARSETPILNWYLYTYGLVTVSLFVAAWLLAPPRDRVLGSSAPAILYTLGTVLAFLLVNVQIADFFTEPGAAALTFKFSGNFGRDMTYSIAWALFALTLLIIGFARRLSAVRYAGIALLAVTLVKVGWHDLQHLEQLFRVGVLVCVAVIFLIAAFLYQRFATMAPKTDETKPTPPSAG